MRRTSERRVPWQEHAENAAFTRFALHCYLTAVLVHDLGNDGQAQAHALRLVVKNGLKMPSRCRASIPAPRSITEISAVPPAARVFTVIAPPGAVACAALSTRLKKTRSISSASKGNGGISGA